MPAFNFIAALYDFDISFRVFSIWIFHIPWYWRFYSYLLCLFCGSSDHWPVNKVTGNRNSEIFWIVCTTLFELKELIQRQPLSYRDFWKSGKIDLVSIYSLRTNVSANMFLSPPALTTSVAPSPWLSLRVHPLPRQIQGPKTLKPGRFLVHCPPRAP